MRCFVVVVYYGTFELSRRELLNVDKGMGMRVLGGVITGICTGFLSFKFCQSFGEFGNRACD